MRGLIWRNNISSEMCHYLRNYFRHEAAGKNNRKPFSCFFFVCTSVVEIDLSSAERTWAEIFMKSAERMYEKVCKNLRRVFTNFLFYTYAIYYLYYLCIYTIYLYYFRYPLFHSFSTIFGKTDGGLMKEKACKNYQRTTLKLY